MMGLGFMGLFGPIIILLRLAALVGFFYSFSLAIRETHKPKKTRDFASAIILALGSIGVTFLTGTGCGMW